MIPAIWNLLKMPYYEFVVVKEPEMIVQWHEFHAKNELTALPGVFPSRKQPNCAFHVLKSHIPYKEGVKSVIFFGEENAINRTGPHQYYPLEDYDVLTAVQHPDEGYEVPVFDPQTGEQAKDENEEPIKEMYYPIRYMTLNTSALKDFYESRADHKVQAEPPPSGLAALLPYIPYIMIGIVIIYVISVLSGNPIVGGH